MNRKVEGGKNNPNNTGAKKIYKEPKRQSNINKDPQVRSDNISVRRATFKFNIYLSLGFIIILLFIFLAGIITKDNKVSEVENRSLEQKPKLSISSYFSGDYRDIFTDYIADQFPGRQRWIWLRSGLLAMQRREVNEVIIGKRGNLMEKFTYKPNSSTDEKIRAINQFKKNHPKMKLSLLMAPTACEINKDFLPIRSVVASEEDYNSYVSARLSRSINFVDVIPAMRKNASRYIYYRTDHHWTSLGAYTAYKVLAKQMDLNSGSESDYKQMIASDSFKGSLHSKVGGARGKRDDITIFVPERTINVVVRYEDERKKVASLYDSTALAKKDQYEVFTSGNHPLLKIKSDGASDRNLLIIKDSFANCMLPFLVQNYSEIIVVDLRYFAGDLNKLIKDEDIKESLILYNTKTFHEDSSLLNLE